MSTRVSETSGVQGRQTKRQTMAHGWGGRKEEMNRKEERKRERRRGREGKKEEEEEKKGWREMEGEKEK